MTEALAERCHQMLARHDAAPVVRAQLAQHLLQQGDCDGAIAAADRALAADPTLVTAWLARAGACKTLCRFAEAAAGFEQAAALLPGRAAILVMLANCHAELDRLEQAELCLRAAIALDPGCREAHANLGSVYLRQQRPDLALAASREALAQDPGSVTAHQNLSVILAATAPEEAARHRDAAYRDRQIFVTRAARPEQRVLVLTSAAQASVPLKCLLPRERYTLIRWFIDYARPDQDLPEFDFIFNAIGDADLAPPLPAVVDRLLRDGARPVLNPPERIARTRRSDLPRLIGDLADVLVPPVLRLPQDCPDPVAAMAAWGIDLPLLVRPAGSHGGTDLVLATGREALTAALAACRGPAYVTKFFDYRSEADGNYRKYRSIFVDRVPYTWHLAIGPRWLSHYCTAGMDQQEEKRAEERRFLEDPQAAIGARACAALAAIARRLDLDYGGIDFSVLPDGRVLVFEANATMLIYEDDDPRFAYRSAALRRILNAFETMLAQRLAGRA